jgi:hypothetical protein
MFPSIFPLPRVEDPQSATTLGAFIAVGYQVRSRCTNAGCNHNVNLNLVVVARYLGVGHSAQAEDLKPYFYCPTCREAGLADENIVFTHYAPTAPASVISERWIADRTAA